MRQTTPDQCHSLRSSFITFLPLQEKLREIESFKETPAQQGKKNILETYKEKNK